MERTELRSYLPQPDLKIVILDTGQPTLTVEALYLARGMEPLLVYSQELEILVNGEEDPEAIRTEAILKPLIEGIGAEIAQDLDTLLVFTLAMGQALEEGKKRGHAE